MKIKATSTNTVSVRARIGTLTASIMTSLLIFSSLILQLSGESVVYAAKEDNPPEVTKSIPLGAFTSLLSAKESNLPTGDIFSQLNVPSIPTNGSLPFEMPQQSNAFVENVGQFDDAVRFQVSIGTNTWFFTDEAIWLTVLEGGSCEEHTFEPIGDVDNLNCSDGDSLPTKGVNIRLTFAGSDPNPRISGLEPLDTKISYIHGNNPDNWYANTPIFTGVLYENVYPGVNIEFRVLEGKLRPTIVSASYADLSPIQLQVEGANSQTVIGNQLQLETEIGLVTLPLLNYQFGKNISLPKPSMDGQTILYPFVNDTVAASIEVPPEDQLKYSTFLGGNLGTSNSTAVNDLVIDSDGNIYVTGDTLASDFPTTLGAFDTTQMANEAFVVKINPNLSGSSSLEYATFLGGSGIDIGYSIGLDANNDVYIAGETTSNDLFNSGYIGGKDGFLAKLVNDGTALSFGVYFGGTDSDYVRDLVVDQAGNSYIVGQTASCENNDVVPFPIIGGFDTECQSARDFMAKFSANGSMVYSTFILGEFLEGGEGIAVDQEGNAYVVGYTESSNYPMTGGDISYNGDGDAFVFKINPNAVGNASLSYGTYLGGSRSDGASAVTVDDSGRVYIVGGTESSDLLSDFPPNIWGFDSSCTNCLNETDSFIAIIDASGTIVESATYLGGSGDESSWGVSVDNFGNIFVTGTTDGGFPTTTNAFDRFYNDSNDIFLTVFNSILNAGNTLPTYSTYFGGDSFDHARGLSVDNFGNAFLAGFTRSEDFPTTPSGYATDYYTSAFGNGFISKLFVVPSNMLFDSQVENENVSCELSSQIDTQGIVGEPINPRNGNYMYMDTDLSMPVAGCQLQFVRAYASDTTDYYTSAMGYGWTHNHDMRLRFTDTAIPGTVEVQTPNGSRLPFYDNGDGTYTPYAGVTAELVQLGSTYIITGYNQKVYTFDAQGLLQEQADPYGNIITFTYNTSDQLIRAGQGDRYLTYAYDSSDRLETVTDNLNRTITLGYDTIGDLTTVTNTLNLVTTYEYSGTTHLLTKVTDPSGTVVEETAYDNDGRAYQQWDGEGNLLVEIDYSLANIRVVTENGVVMTYTYDTRNTLVGIEYACTDGTAGCQANSNIAYDGNFKQDSVADLNGNPTTLDWNDGGSNLEYVQDALDNETFLAYDQFNNLTETVDARGNATRYFYDNSSFPTFLTKMTDDLGNSTFYTPTTAVDGVPGLLKQQEDPNGRITTYSYNDFGQITEMVVAAGTSDAVTTTYDYDAVGRLTTTTQTSAGESHTNLNVYDGGDRLIATIANWDNVLSWQNCSFASGSRDENICTLYDYDNAGRIISTTNALGQTNLTFYDDAGRTFLNVTNWDGSNYNAANPLPDLCNFSNPDPEFNLCSQTEYDEFGRVYTTTNTLGYQNVTEYDSLGRVGRSISNWQDGIFNANDPDGDIETLYEYDANGNTLIVTDTVGRMTHTYYDALNRVEGTVTNWDGSTTLAGCASLPAMRDNNICTQYEYDEVGNTIIVTDTLGRMTRTFYDDLNRVEATVVNWQPSLTTPNNCVLSATNDTLENICTLYGYDDAGNQITTTNALNQTSLTVYDSANRPFLTVQNWDGTPISSENDCSFPPAESDSNVCFVTYFDELGRRSSSKDALGNLTDYDYDGLGRIITTTRYLDNGATPVETSIEYDALGNRLTQTDAEGNDISFLFDELNRMETSKTDEGVTFTNYYNAAGWVTQTVDTLLHPTTFDYDDLGRRLTVTDAETNVTEYEYDALGNQTAMIDVFDNRKVNQTAVQNVTSLLY